MDIAVAISAVKSNRYGIFGMARRFSDLDPVHCVYLLRDDAGRVRYVGSGNPLRPAESGAQRKMRPEIIMDGLKRHDAYRVEARFIALFGLEMLLNKSLGYRSRKYRLFFARRETMRALAEKDVIKEGNYYRGVVRSKLTGRIVLCGVKRFLKSHSAGWCLDGLTQETMLIAILADWRIEDAA